jgi:antitoxin (DNA-binding transcriptional repressor) of toxin-antitoxin stability system
METTRSTPPAPQKIGLREFRARMAHYLNLVIYRGISLYLVRKGRAIVRIDPLTEDAEEQILVRNAGKMPEKL